MSQLAVFDRTLEKTNRFLDSVTEALGWSDRQAGYLATRATLHALRDRLFTDEAVHLGAQLPLLLRGIYYEGWRPTETPHKNRHLRDFLGEIEAELRRGSAETEVIARAVFQALSQAVSPGEIQDVVGAFPAELKSLWPPIGGEDDFD